MEEKKSNGTKGAAKWKEVAIGGISGIALGTAGTLFASSIPFEASAENVDSENANTETEPTNTTAQMATHVTDSMSFSDAFNAAREEVGAGGVFEWHGNLYSTYTAAEWYNMDATARNEFADSIHWDGPSHEYVSSNHSQSSHSTHSTHTEEVTNTQIVSNGNTTQTQSPNKDEEDSPDVEIIGVEHANIDGEHDSIIGTASINGQAVYFIDVDGEDNEFELMVSDTNGNNQVDEGEVVDISEQHMSVEEIRKRLETASVVGADETGATVGKHLHWNWIFQNDLLTYVFQSESRGQKAIDSKFPKGLPYSTLVTDRHQSYFKMNVKDHQVCLAHLLRNAEYLNELDSNQDWSRRFIQLIEHSINLRREGNITSRKIKVLKTKMKNLLGESLTHLDNEFEKFKRGILKVKDYLFTFLSNPSVPYDNNASERGVRKIKIKQKVSGCFRTDGGADDFAKLHSIAETAMKNGNSKFNAILAVVQQ